jgi:hypothetical protein
LDQHRQVEQAQFTDRAAIDRHEVGIGKPRFGKAGEQALNRNRDRGAAKNVADAKMRAHCSDFFDCPTPDRKKIYAQTESFVEACSFFEITCGNGWLPLAAACRISRWLSGGNVHQQGLGGLFKARYRTAAPAGVPSPKSTNALD